MQTHSSATAATQFTKLQAFRQAAYACLGNGRAALFDLADAVLVTPAVNSFAELACAPVFRRRWASLYAALQDGRPDRAALLRLYVQQLPAGGRMLLAGDHTAWPRLSAPTLARPQDRACADQDCGQPADHHRLRLQHAELGAGVQPAVGRRRCCLNASAVPRRRTRRAPSSYAASARSVQALGHTPGVALGQ